MTYFDIANQYIQLLEKGDEIGIVGLFSETGKVVSPLYGTRLAADFYAALGADTKSSELMVRGFIENNSASQVALFFNYTWTKKSGEKVVFDVVDILEFDADNKIDCLTIIYDTFNVRKQ